jgi:hypothetical protein
MDAAPTEGIGITETERYLNRLARRSFLSLWSYPGPYRSQRAGVGGDGKELCDLLVVFENHVLIFSDKDCEFPDLADEGLAWRRWYKRAILKSAEQIWGAERWVRDHPDRLFLDRACTRPFPIDLPDPATIRFHRIVVAHDTTGRRKRRIGGTGSLLIDPEIVGDMHLLPPADGGRLFALGNINPDKGYVHVLDDASLGRVMRALDTIPEFVNYLTRKETFILSGRLRGAFGEEDLLGYYLKNTNEDGDHDFPVPHGAEKIVLEEGHWADMIRRPEYRRKLTADRISYAWDEIIENISGSVVDGSLIYTSVTEVATHERRLLRVLAREPRVRRRMLAQTLGEKIVQPLSAGQNVFRVVQPSFAGDPHYVFMIARPPKGVVNGTLEWEKHREDRRDRLKMYCIAAMRRFAEAEQVIGIATENGSLHGRSYDCVSIDRRDWDEEMQSTAAEIQNMTGWLRHNLQEMRGYEDEYPMPERTTSPRIAPSVAQLKVGRNDRCPCGSGKKYKHCHGTRL